MLTERQIDRYSRQIILPEVGAHGQQTLLASGVSLVGAGEEGALLLLYLAAAGIGRVTVLNSETSRGLEEWMREAHALNDDCRLEVVHDEAAAVDGASVILTTTPDAPVVRRIAAGGMRTATAVIWGRVDGDRGYLGTFRPTTGSGCPACFAAGLAAPGESTGALVASTRALLASLLATEAIRHIEGLTPPESPTILRIDPVDCTVVPVSAVKRPDCDMCGTRFSS